MYPAMYANAHSRSGSNLKAPFAAGAWLSLNNTGEAQQMFFDNAQHWAFTPKVYESQQNFSYQKFDVMPDVESGFDLTGTKTFSFRIQRLLDVLVGYYLTFNLPDIYSPVYHPCPETNETYSPYEFQWIDDFCEIIDEYTVTILGQTIFRGDGKSLRLLKNRDAGETKLRQFNEAVGAVPELHSPQNSFNRYSTYPNVCYSQQMADLGVSPAPSIPGRTIMIPLHEFFHPCGFPMHLLEANTSLELKVTLKPVSDWFRVRDVFDFVNDFPRVRPEFNEPQFQLYRFLQPPPSIDLSAQNYLSKPQAWESNLHLITEFVALSEIERRNARNNPNHNVMLFRNITKHVYPDIQGYFEAKILNPSKAFVSSLIIAPQRSDVARRNEWSNYTNWPYKNELPSNIQAAATTTDDFDPGSRDRFPPMSIHRNHTPTSIYVTGQATTDNEKYICLTMGLNFDGNEREKSFPFDIYRQLDLFNKCPGIGTDGVGYYQFAKNSSPYAQLTNVAGIANWGGWNRISVVGTTLVPTLNPRTVVPQQFLCNEQGDNVISVSYTNYTPFDYKYTLTIYEERINVILFEPTLKTPTLLYVV